MAFLRSLLFTIFFYAGSAAILAIGVAISAVNNRFVTKVPLTWARWHRWCARYLIGIRTRIEGVKPDGAYLFAAKHQAMYETAEAPLLFDHVIPVLKRELIDLPGWGWIARRYGVIPVDREAGASALRDMLKAARTAKASGRPVLIFPEGTRVAAGETPPLQSGFAGLYKALDMPVVPIAIDSGRLCPRGRFIMRPGIVTFRFGEIIPNGLDRTEIEARVHAAINALEVNISSGKEIGS